jgi:hypothetical protein
MHALWGAIERAADGNPDRPAHPAARPRER